jgi:hypothetical protein
MVRAAMKVKTFVSYRVNAACLILPVSRIDICEMTRTDTSSRSMQGFSKLSACKTSEALEG